jgi:ankyrin repeat protein/truncated hemoglobin YjbI
MSHIVPKELLHRGEGLVEYPDPKLFETLGGRAGVSGLIDDLYRRIPEDPLLRQAFPHCLSPGEAARFFQQWFGGKREYSNELAGGLLRRHQHRYISPKTAAAWLRCMRESLEARDADVEKIMPTLSRIAKAMIHSPETKEAALHRDCRGVLETSQVRLAALLSDSAKGRTDEIRKALKKDPALARARGLNGQTLVWVAVYRNRPKILQAALEADGSPNLPGCDPLQTTMACDDVHVGTGVSVTPLALAKRWQPALVPTLIEHGAIDDVFTAAWVGDVSALRGFLDRNPQLISAIDPADDFQEVSLLGHAVCGGNIDCVKLLLERKSEVQPHSGKLLTLAVVMNRADLVRMLLDHGADIQTVGYLGPLDDAQRPVADLLIARGKKVPPRMLPRACRPDVSSNELHRVKVLLDYGANPDDRDRQGHTALHYAVRGGKLPLIKFLLNRGAKPDALDDEGLTPLLHLVKSRAKFDPIPVMELLAARGANIDARDDMQGTLLMHYARQGNADAVRCLLAHGADRNARNKSGKSVADVARANAAIARLLTKKVTA